MGSAVSFTRKHRVHVTAASPEGSPDVAVPSNKGLVRKNSSKGRSPNASAGTSQNHIDHVGLTITDKANREGGESPRVIGSSTQAVGRQTSSSALNNGRNRPSPAQRSDGSRQGSSPAVRQFSPPRGSPGGDDDSDYDNLSPNYRAGLSHGDEDYHGPHGHQEEEEGEPLDKDEADMFLQTAMSLGMDNEDLLFNMMFFEDGNGPATFGALLNTMQEETLALHSENNTPYKLRPANEKAKSSLIEEVFVHANHHDPDSENECQVCKDVLEDGQTLLRIPTCKHFFHKECLIRWIELQAWCPVCRSELTQLQLQSAGASSSGDKDRNYSSESKDYKGEFDEENTQRQGRSKEKSDVKPGLDTVSEIGVESEEPTPYNAGIGDDDDEGNYSPTREALIRHLDFSAMMIDPDNSLCEFEQEMERDEREMAIMMQMMQLNNSNIDLDTSIISTHSTKSNRSGINPMSFSQKLQSKGSKKDLRLSLEADSKKTAPISSGAPTNRSHLGNTSSLLDEKEDVDVAATKRAMMMDEGSDHKELPHSSRSTRTNGDLEHAVAETSARRIISDAVNSVCLSARGDREISCMG